MGDFDRGLNREIFTGIFDRGILTGDFDLGNFDRGGF